MLVARAATAAVEELPPGWILSSLGEHYNFKNGLNKGRRFFGYGTPIINYMDVYRHQWLVASHVGGKVSVTKDEMQSYSARQADAFFTRTSETVSEIGLCSVLMEPIGNAVFSGFLLRGRPLNRELLPEFAAYALRGWAVRRQIEASATYTTRALTNGRSLSKVTFALPPESEQRAIAQALRDADELLASIDKLIAKRNNLKAAAIQQLLTGRTRLPKFSENWQRTRLGEIAKFSRGRGLPKSALNPDGSFPCIHYGELFTFYGPSIDRAFSRTDQKANHVLSVAGDVLMPTSDVTPTGLAKASCINEEGVIIGGDTLIIRPDARRLSGVFLAHKLRFEKKAILNLVRGSTVYHLYASDLAHLQLFLPGLDEQLAIAKVLSSMEDDIAQLARKRAKLAALKEGMTQQLLAGRIKMA